MPFRCVLLTLLLCPLFAPAAELRTLKGEVLKGDLTRITDQEIVLSRAGKEVATPVGQVLQVDMNPTGKLAADVSYSDVELTDGSLLHCKEVSLKGKQVEITLLTGQTVKIPLTAVSNVIKDANEPKNRKDWSERLSKKRRRDVVAVLKNGVVNTLEGTLGEGDEEGKTIAFTLSGGRKVSVGLARVHGLIFERQPDADAPPTLCKLSDTVGNLLLVSKAVATPTGLVVTTPAGARIEYATAQVARLDYSRGKLTFLSDLQPVYEDKTPSEYRNENYKRDQNLEGQPLRLGNNVYAKGLALQSYTALEYDLKGEYREFRAIIGIDDTVNGSEGATRLQIEGDGKELTALSFDRKDKKRFKPVALNVKDIQRLRIIVSSGSLFDLGKHLDLADAKVSK